ncbi:MAG TPA: hypothetical protein VHN99_10490, partial [Deinococcales bacterium]|nr:hypothetical protein [Deinococcales bacterium]
RRGWRVKPSLMVVTIVLFAGAVRVFSGGYNTLLRYFEQPTTTGLVSLAAWVAALIVLLAALGFVMYATERRLGNVKVKNHLFERLLGHGPNDPLPTPRAPAAVKASGRSK